MWGALLATTIAGWLHQLTATTRADGTLACHGSSTTGRGGPAVAIGA